MPAAVSRWPTFVLTEPMGNGVERCSHRASASACASIGSPTAVPVPCASTNPICAGETPASLHASWTSRVCASVLGSEIPFVCPS